MIDLDQIYRTERGRVLASLIRLLGGFDLAEEALAEAFLAAAQQWPRTGIQRLAVPSRSRISASPPNV